MILGANISFNIDKRGESELTFLKLLFVVYVYYIAIYYFIVDEKR